MLIKPWQLGVCLTRRGQGGDTSLPLSPREEPQGPQPRGAGTGAALQDAKSCCGSSCCDGPSKLSKTDLSPLLQQQLPGLVSLSAVSCEQLQAELSDVSPPWSGWIRFCLIKITISSFPLLQEEEEKGLKAVHYLAQLEPGTGHGSGLLQPGQLQEASGTSRC